jgi:branched-chain amino acid transport system substrate-binding protein
MVPEDRRGRIGNCTYLPGQGAECLVACAFRHAAPEKVSRTLPAQHDGGSQYPLSALVCADGSIEELSGRSALSLLEQHPQLVAWAVAFLATRATSARFWWQSRERGWYRIRIDPSESVGVVEEAAVIGAWPSTMPHDLTTRELDVLTLVAAGMSNADIAEALVVSRRTVTTHVEHLLMKLDQPNRAAAAVYAAEEGLIRLPIPGTDVSAETLVAGRLDSLTRSAVTRAFRQDAPPGNHATVRRPLLVGSAFPLKGAAAADGWEMANGAALAIAEINARGGIAGRMIEHVLVDVDIFSANAVQAAMRELVEAEVDAITMGYVFPEELALRTAADYGAPFLHGMTSETQVQHVRDDRATFSNIFEVCPTEIHYGREFVRFVSRLERAGVWRPINHKLLFLETIVPSGQMLTAETIDLANVHGWETTRLEMLPTGADAAAAVREVRMSNPAALMVTQFFPAELASFQRQFAATESETLVYAVYAPSIPEFLRASGQAAEGLIWATTTGTYSDRLGSAFAHRYASKYGAQPGRSHAGLAYDEVYVLAYAWASTSNPRRFADVSEALRATAHRGVNGAYTFDDEGQVGLAYPSVTLDASLGQAHLIFQVQNGRHQILSPAPYAEATFLRPSWFPAKRRRKLA